MVRQKSGDERLVASDEQSNHPMVAQTLLSRSAAFPLGRKRNQRSKPQLRKGTGLCYRSYRATRLFQKSSEVQRVTFVILFKNQLHGLLPKSAVQFTTRVSGVFAFTLSVVMTNCFPSGVTSYWT